jgi:SNF2 family DNA or RNA helicase
MAVPAKSRDAIAETAPAPKPAPVKPKSLRSLKDILSHLRFEDAVKLLGGQGTDARRLLARASGYAVDLKKDVYFRGDLMRVNFPSLTPSRPVVVTITVDSEHKDRLVLNCTVPEVARERIAQALHFVLDQKTALGLAAPPPAEKTVRVETDEELRDLAIRERRERAKTERMKIESSDPSTPWTEYRVTSLVSGKQYRAVLRGLGDGQKYCSCPDFRTNTLATCKHLLKLEARVKAKFDAATLKKPFKLDRIEVHVSYREEPTLRLTLPAKCDAVTRAQLEPYTTGPITNTRKLITDLEDLARRGVDFHVFPDAEEFIQQTLYAQRVSRRVAEIRKDPATHPLRTSLLKVPLLPYQMDGIAFVVGAGRAVLADEMGLGKTIQAIGASELFAREANIERVLVVCPASLKSQWQREIEAFSGRSTQIVSGPVDERDAQYKGEAFFTICNYEQVLRDYLSIAETPWDLIILDEGQRIKNWEAKTTRTIKSLKSRFALVLSGTPLENRLDDLYSVVQFVDDRRLGPGFRFFHRHTLLDDAGKPKGYQHLDELRENLRPVLLRRTRDSVRLELPERTEQIVRIPPSKEQKGLHDVWLQTVAEIVSKKFLTEMDLMRLRMALLMCRMAADGTYLVDKKTPNHSTKLERLVEIFEEFAEAPDRKAILFSEWTTMLDLIEPSLKKLGLRFVRLDGSVPQKERAALVHEFQTDPACRLFLTTNAGSTGLNLQAANTVINVDLPWNPAILEQRIARAHRMGQKNPVHVYKLVTEDTLEESLLATLLLKKDLALAALDAESTVDTVEMTRNSDDLKKRLEILLGAKPEAPLVTPPPSPDPTSESARRDRVASAGGEMLGAVFHFLGELVARDDSAAPLPEETVAHVRNRLDECLTTDEAGRPRLTFTLPDKSAIDGLAKTLARLVAMSPGE